MLSGPERKTFCSGALSNPNSRHLMLLEPSSLTKKTHPRHET